MKKQSLPRTTKNLLGGAVSLLVVGCSPAQLEGTTSRNTPSFPETPHECLEQMEATNSQINLAFFGIIKEQAGGVEIELRDGNFSEEHGFWGEGSIDFPNHFQCLAIWSQPNGSLTTMADWATPTRKSTDYYDYWGVHLDFNPLELPQPETLSLLCTSDACETNEPIADCAGAIDCYPDNVYLDSGLPIGQYLDRITD